MNIEDKVLNLVMEVLGLEKNEITVCSKINEDLGSDSLDDVEILMEIEREFNICISDEDASLFWRRKTTVQDICDYLRKTHKIN